MRLAVVNLVPAPYREPIYRRLAQTSGIHLRVFYLQSRDSLRGWSSLPCSYEAVKLRSLTPESLYSVPLLGLINPGLIRQLRHFSPNCLLVHGYSYLPQMSAMRWAIRRRTPYLLWADSNSHRLAAGGLGSTIRNLCIRYFTRYAAGAVTIGSLNEEFWRCYGLQCERQFRSPLAVDNEYFAREAAIWRGQKTAVRKSLGLPEGRLLLFVGRFAAAKNLETLLRALSACQKDGDHTLSLALVGDGPEKSRWNQMIRQLELRRVFPFGFQPQTELPRFYGTADALVLPSRYEPWGLVVNEAMASGLPVLLSKSTGCLPDLLEEGSNGFSFDENSVASVTACLKRFSRASDQEVIGMGARSAQLISSWSFDNALAGIYRALEFATGGEIVGASRDQAPAAGCVR